MSSKRLKGKVLKLLGRKYLLEWVVENVAKSKHVNKIVIATSKYEDDDRVYDFCQKKKILCFRGSLNNVYARFVGVLKKYDNSSFLRITADSPFIDPTLIDLGITIYKKGKYHMVTNTFPRSFPKGQSISIYNSRIFINNLNKVKKKHHKEHITSFFYENAQNFKIKNFLYKFNYSKLNMSVDTRADFDRAKKVVKNLNFDDKKNYLSNLIKFFQK